MHRRPRGRSRTCVVLLALALPSAVACGGDDPAPDTDRNIPAEDTAGIPVRTPDPGDSSPPGVNPVIDSADRSPSGEPAAGAEAPPDTGEDAGEDAGASALPPWTTGIVDEGGSIRGVAEIGRIRLGRDPGFDRVVLDFNSDDLPGFHAEYIDKPLHECGSGNQIHPVGDAWLEIRLEPARAHTEAGEASLTATRSAESLPLVERIYRTCDFEAVVTVVLAVRSPNPFRVFTLRDPARLVVDVRR